MVFAKLGRVVVIRPDVPYHNLSSRPCSVSGQAR
jgi:hypothetical protein